MSRLLKLLLALCALGLVVLFALFPFGAREWALLLLAVSAGLLAGRLIRGSEAGTSDADDPTAARSGARAETDEDAARAVALLEATMSGMREGVLVLDGSLRVVSANRAARSVLGFGSDKLAGLPLSALTRDPSIHAAYLAALKEREDTQVKVELHGAARRTVELRVSPLRLEEGRDSRAAIGVFFDITELERLERVRQEFLSNVSHELRTPLTAILTFVETLEDGALEDPESARRFVGIIRRNSERMRTLIEDIMELSAIESGGTEVSAREVRLFPTAQEAFAALASKAEACGVSLVNEVSTETTVHADPRRLEQMLLNLVDNAIKFNRRGGTVTITHDEQGARDLITVADTGEGIPLEHLPRIFERFYRVDRARSRELGGTGLGLAIVKHLARAHGGEVRVRSTPGEGSTFIIELPRPQFGD